MSYQLRRSMNRTIELILFLVLFSISHTAPSQKTKKTVIKNQLPDTKEVFYVLKDDYQTKHGKYTKYLGDMMVCSGTYDSNERTGNWEYYNSKGGIEQIVNYDTYQLIQNNNPKNVSPEPVALGGMQIFYTYIARTMKYPARARKKGTQGKVFVKFTINPDGSTSNFHIEEGIGDGCDEEALRAFQTIGFEYYPALDSNGNQISSTITLPVIFKLHDSY